MTLADVVIWVALIIVAANAAPLVALLVRYRREARASARRDALSTATVGFGTS